jgi:hypothetical protein
MIIVKNASLAHPSEQWIALSLGETDPYGNPFTIIELRYNKSRLRAQTDYSKTKGDIEDTIITANTRDGGVEIRYRQNGSIMWEQKDNIGPYTGKLARTPRNVAFLAEHYGDRLWQIRAPISVENEVKALWQKMRDGMTEDQREADDKRIAQLHTHYMAKPDEPMDAPVPDKTVDMEEKRNQYLKQQELENRELEIAERERKLGIAEAAKIKAGAVLTRYTEKHLRGLKIYELRKLARETKAGGKAADTIDVLVGKIMAVQEGAEYKPGGVEAEKVTA